MSLSTTEAEALIIEFCGYYPVASSIKFAVRATQEELYGTAGSPELIGKILGGFHSGEGRADFVTSNFRDAQHFRQIIAHEVLGHFGINTFSPADKRAVLDAISAARDQPGLRDVWSEVDQLYADLTELGKAEEVYAFVCEGTGMVRGEDIAAGRRALEEACLNGVRRMRLDDLVNLTALVAAGLRDRTRHQRTFPANENALFGPANQPRREGLFFGRIIALEFGEAIQNIKPGAPPFHHRLDDLSGSVHVGDVVEIRYKAGIGMVTTCKAIDRGR